MLRGKKVGLRKVQRGDLDSLMKWRNDDTYRQYFREYRELNLDDQVKWYEKLVLQDQGTLMFSIIDLTSQELVGACGLCYINWVQRNADLSLYIGKDGIYIDTSVGGYAWDSMEVLFRYAFEELNLYKIWTEIYTIDEKKKELFETFGMNRDAILRDNYFYRGKYINSYIYSMLQPEFLKKGQTGL
jgi:RimJ/RimL family protein N-acetyltransferase